MRILPIGILVAAAMSASTQQLHAQQQEETWALHVAQADVDFGKSFALRVVRTWPATIAPTPFPADALEPLQLKLVDIGYSQAADRMTETRLFSARAFEAGEIRVGTSAQLVDPLVFRVRSSLSPTPGPLSTEPSTGGEPRGADVAELGLELRAAKPQPSGAPLWISMLVALAVVAGAVWLTHRQLQTSRQTRTPKISLDALRAIKARLQSEPRSELDLRESASALAATARAFIEQENGMDCAGATSDQLLARLRASVTPDQHKTAAALFAATDAALFANHADRDALLAAFDPWLRAWTQSGSEDVPLGNSSVTG